MNSLVGYGVSSDSDSDGAAEDVNSGKAGSGKTCEEEAPFKKTRNFLLESGSASSESEAEDEDPEPSPPPTSAARPSKLPTPSLDSITSKKLPSPALNASSDSSVFANPFKAQADQKLSALQKHVPLTMQAKPSQIGVTSRSQSSPLTVIHLRVKRHQKLEAVHLAEGPRGKQRRKSQKGSM
ncbi:uncharacterized protein LOC102208920 isoform X2 [Pundamilia nyererei]|uniref:Uncharacterized protein LOC102208920 isoform X2 n=1 Tax=Pundamilia nyererei TaxID=303518 RepID=A0A9Y6JIZ5_9CICH|nr:PREDICTED: uncharacterized protein LOC102208920 isoform X2 [Pundamilia nyererei]